MNRPQDLFATLDRRLDLLLDDYRRLRAENQTLREQVRVLEDDKAALSGRIQAAATRLQALHDRLPPDTTP